MTNANLLNISTVVSTQFISNETTKQMASFVKSKYNELYKGVHWSKAPVFETICFQEAENILNCVNVPSDAHKMNMGFLEAIKIMGFDFNDEFQIEEWENMLLDLPFENVDELFTIEQIID